MKSIKFTILTLALLLLGACSESSPTSSETGDNSTEPEVNNYVLPANGQIKCYDDMGNVLSAVTFGETV